MILFCGRKQEAVSLLTNMYLNWADLKYFSAIKRLRRNSKAGPRIDQVGSKIPKNHVLASHLPAHPALPALRGALSEF